MSKSELFYQQRSEDYFKLLTDLWELTIHNKDIPQAFKDDYHAIFMDRMKLSLEKDNFITNAD